MYQQTCMKGKLREVGFNELLGRRISDNLPYIMALAQTGYGKSFWQADPRFLHDAERLQLRPSWDLSIANASDLLASSSSRIYADGVTENFASLHHDHVPDGIWRYSPQSILTPVFEN
jgi:hypothetical protein